MALHLCDHRELVGHWFWSWDHRRFGIWVRDPMWPYCRRRGKSYRNSHRSALVLLVRGLSYPSYEIAHHFMRHIGWITLTDRYLAELTIHPKKPFALFLDLGDNSLVDAGRMMLSSHDNKSLPLSLSSARDRPSTRGMALAVLVFPAKRRQPVPKYSTSGCGADGIH